MFTLNLLFIKMDFTTAEGFFAPGALFYPQAIEFDNSLAGGGAGVKWFGYKDADHVATCQNPIAIITDATSSQEYFAAIQQPVTTGISHAADTGKVIALLAISHKTIPVLNADGITPTMDSSGQPVMVSPFEQGQIVVLPITV